MRGRSVFFWGGYIYQNIKIYDDSIVCSPALRWSYWRAAWHVTTQRRHLSSKWTLLTCQEPHLLSAFVRTPQHRMPHILGETWNCPYKSFIALWFGGCSGLSRGGFNWFLFSATVYQLTHHTLLFGCKLFLLLPWGIFSIFSFGSSHVIQLYPPLPHGNGTFPCWSSSWLATQLQPLLLPPGTLAATVMTALDPRPPICCSEPRGCWGWANPWGNHRGFNMVQPCLAPAGPRWDTVITCNNYNPNKSQSWGRQSWQYWWFIAGGLMDIDQAGVLCSKLHSSFDLFSHMFAAL